MKTTCDCTDTNCTGEKTQGPQGWVHTKIKI